MPRPNAEPPLVVLRAKPGETRGAIVSILKVPSGADVTASILGGGGAVALRDVVALEIIQRPATEEEILELPPFPPSLRNKLRMNGIREHVEHGRSDGATPLAVPPGAMLQFHLEAVVPPQQAPDLIDATLVIEGSGWDRVEVPVTLLVGEAIVGPAIEPTGIRRAAEPGETLVQDLVINPVPASAKIVAFVDGGGSIIRLQKAIAFRPVRRRFTEEEIEELPPFPPEIRQNARTNGYIEYQEAGRTEGPGPLAVSAGMMLRLYVEFAAPEQLAPDSVSATLVIEGTTWQRVEVPLFLIIGKVTVVPRADANSVRQGEGGDLGLEVTSVAGPATAVELQLGMDDGQWKITPAVFHLPRGAAIAVAAKVAVEPTAPLGAYPVGIEVRTFERLMVRNLPFQLTVRPARVFVRAIQPSLVATQGDRITCAVELISRGGHKKMSFTAGALPPGVRMEAPSPDFHGAVTTVINVDLVVDPLARPVANARTTITWSAGDGEHSGTLELTLTILLRLETRTFSQPIVTGAALGGHVNLTLQNDGNCRFSGFMRATGFPSYKFRLRAVARGAGGLVAAAAQKTGEVFGTDTPGNRQLDWDEPFFSSSVAEQWADLRTAAMTVNRSTELSGVLGTLADVLGDVLEFVASAALLSPIPGGPALAGLVFLGSELGALAGVRVVGPGGLVGIATAGGVAFALGPGMIIPAFVGGVLVGNLAIQHRAMNETEKNLARGVFGDSLPFDRIILTNLSGQSGQEFTVPNVDGSILVNLGDGFDNPDTHVDPPRGYGVPGQILIHELVHAWQIAHIPFVSELLWNVMLDTVEGGSAYRYGPAGPPWSSFGLEQQGSIVDEWFAGTNVRATNPVASRTPMNTNDPYFTYIANNIRLEQN